MIENLLRIIGFENHNLEQIEDTVVGQRPADLISGLPSRIRVYSDICEPYITGNVHTPLLRIVPLNMVVLRLKTLPRQCIFPCYLRHFNRSQ